MIPSSFLTISTRTAVLAFLLLVSMVITAAAAPLQPAEPAPGFSTYYGGSTEECLFTRCSVTYDNEGNIIIAGSTRSPDFPTINAWMEDTADGSTEDWFLVKLTPDGQNVIFSTYIGDGSPRDVAVDSNNDIYVAGRTGTRNFPTTPNAIQDCTAGGVKAAVIKMRSDGQELLYSSCLHGEGASEAWGVAVDGAGNMIVTGSTTAENFPTMNPAQNSNGGREDIFVSKIAADGSSLIFSTYLGGEGRDYAYDVDTDPAGNVYGGGRSGEPATFPQTAGVVGPDDDRGTAVVFKFQPNGQLAYSSLIGEVTHEATRVSADDDGNLTFLWNNFNGVGKLNSDASAFIYRSEVDIEVGEGASYGGMAVDSQGRVFVTGRVDSDNNGKEIAVAALNEQGRQVFFDIQGGTEEDTGDDIAVWEGPDDTIDTVIVGTTRSSNFPLLNPLQNSLNGADDMAVFNILGLETALNLKEVYLPTIQRP